jgi:hypothetical protein
VYRPFLAAAKIGVAPGHTAHVIAWLIWHKGLLNIVSAHFNFLNKHELVISNGSTMGLQCMKNLTHAAPQQTGA